MKFRKVLQYGLMTTCLFGNAMAMNEIHDLQENAVLRHESLRDIKAASEIALAESREFHIFLGVNPSEHHAVQLREAEEKREREEGIKAPIRLYFVNTAGKLYGTQTSSAKTPILHADFNKEESWNTILEALMLESKSFNGVVDKIYFDVSTAKAAYWDEDILAKIAILLKRTGEIYIPDAKLTSQSLFCDSLIDQKTYQTLTKTEKNVLPHQPNRQAIEKLFLSRGGMAGMEKRDEIFYVYNSLSLVYDTAYQSSKIIGHPLKFEVFKGDEMYPNIGIDYRQEPKEIIEQCFRINSFIKVTLDGAEKKESKEIALPISIVSATRENLIKEVTPDLAPIAFVPKISIEEGYKEVKFPRLALIKEKLNNGISTISSETDSFNVTSIFGIFIGFNFPVLDVEMKCMGISQDHQNKSSYGIYGAFNVMFDGNKKTTILLKSSYRKESGYIVQGGTKTEKGNFYIASDPEDLKIMVIKK